MGSACTKSDATVADGKSTKPKQKEMTAVQPQAGKSSSPNAGGSVILVSARAPPLESASAATIASPTSAGSADAEASTQQQAQQQAGSSEVRGAPAPAQLLSTPNLVGKKLSARRASGSQMLADSAALLNPHAAPAASGTPAGTASRRISRPSTPISRSVSEQARMGLSSPASPALAGRVDPLGWGVAPNSAAAFELAAPTTTSSAFTLGGVSSARASRRRTEQPGVKGIPETIAERLNREPTAAASALPVPSSATSAAAHNRRASGTERISLRGLPALGSKPAPDGSATATSTPSSRDPHQHQHQHRAQAEGGHGFGARAKEEESRYELTDAQERELREKPFLWTEPAIWKNHPQACFSYYASLPLQAASPTAASSAAAAAANSNAVSDASASSASKTSLSSLPSIHHADRIVWPQLQCLARDCIQRLYLLVRKDVKRSLESAHEILEDSQIEKRIWKELESLLPGHGSESKTREYVALFLLSSLAKTVPGSVGRREFLVLWPETHAALFAWPASEVNLKERKKLHQRIYGLRLEEMLKPFAPAAPTTAAASAVASVSAFGAASTSGEHHSHHHHHHAHHVHAHHSPSPDPSSSSGGGGSDARSPSHALSAPRSGDRSRRQSLNNKEQAQLTLALSAATDNNLRGNAERRGSWRASTGAAAGSAGGNSLLPVSSHTSSRRGSFNASGSPVTLGENLLLSAALAGSSASTLAVSSRQGSAANSSRNSQTRPLSEEEQALVDERREMRQSRRASKQASRSRSRSHKRSHSRSPAAKEAE